jgi:NAD+ synthase (glutamine-hydrolysing)
VARDEKIPLAQVNAVGANDELIFDGHSVALDAHAAKSSRWEKVFAEEILVVDFGESGKRKMEIRKRISRRARRRFFPRLSLGIRDYVRKCGFKSVILGLSGGIDSALVAVLAADALGAENVLGVAMPARYSSSGSLTDAEALAKNLGIRYEVLPIEPVFNSVEKQLEKVFAGTKPNEAEENIQSRLRGVTLMALSNKFGALVLTTGNKSEMAVGYCTLYGDMNGALAPHRGRFENGRLQNRALGEPRARNHSRKIRSPSRRARNCGQTRRIRIRCRPMKFWTRFWICMS